MFLCSAILYYNHFSLLRWLSPLITAESVYAVSISGISMVFWFGFLILVTHHYAFRFLKSSINMPRFFWETPSDDRVHIVPKILQFFLNCSKKLNVFVTAARYCWKFTYRLHDSASSCWELLAFIEKRVADRDIQPKVQTVFRRVSWNFLKHAFCFFKMTNVVESPAAYIANSGISPSCTADFRHFITCTWLL